MSKAPSSATGTVRTDQPPATRLASITPSLCPRWTWPLIRAYSLTASGKLIRLAVSPEPTRIGAASASVWAPGKNVEFMSGLARAFTCWGSSHVADTQYDPGGTLVMVYTPRLSERATGGRALIEIDRSSGTGITVTV